MSFKNLMSKAFNRSAGGNDAYTAMFGSLYVVGDDWFDTVCVGNVPSDATTNCAKQFRFLAVTDIAQNLTPMDGMLGLGPDDPSNGPSYVAAL